MKVFKYKFTKTITVFIYLGLALSVAAVAADTYLVIAEGIKSAANPVYPIIQYTLMYVVGILLFIILIWRGLNIAMNSVDMFGCLIASGIVIMIAIQVILNIAVVTNTIPNTGIPLPFISYGGTPLVFMMGSIGVLLNISRYSKVVSRR